MNRNWIVVNMFLIAVAGVLGWQLYLSAQRFQIDNDPAGIVPRPDPKSEISGGGELLPLQAPQRVDALEFGSIPSKNLFTATRGVEDAQEEAPAEPEAQPLTNKPVLVGVTLVGGEQTALVNDPASKQARRTKIVRLGDTFEGYTVTEISANRMVLEYGSRREVIPLYDPAKHPTPSGKTPIIATRVVNFGKGAASGSTGTSRTTAQPTQQAVRTTRDQGRRVVTTSTPTTSSRASGRSNTQQTRQSATRQGNAQNRSATKSANETIDAQGRRIIRTPFGDIVRPAPKKKKP
jgi:hypothetical protein